MKKYVILKPGCREIANHLWNYISIYAYGLETGTRVYNPSFFAWHRYFNSGKKGSRLWKTFLSLYGSLLIHVRAKCVRVTFNAITYLPPTKSLSVSAQVCGTTYFIGWLFRNPVGLERYRDEIVSAFLPKKYILNKIGDVLAPLSGKRLIGVHIRQQPYKGFEDENFIVSPARVRHIVDEYLCEKKLNTEDVALVIVSDRDIDQTLFSDFTTYISHEGEVTNLFLLSKCSVIIGTNSTFSNLAAWFGSIPHIVESNESIDWEYYRNITTYFENKYATFAV